MSPLTRLVQSSSELRMETAQHHTSDIYRRDDQVINLRFNLASKPTRHPFGFNSGRASIPQILRSSSPYPYLPGGGGALGSRNRHRPSRPHKYQGKGENTISHSGAKQKKTYNEDESRYISCAYQTRIFPSTKGHLPLCLASPYLFICVSDYRTVWCELNACRRGFTTCSGTLGLGCRRSDRRR